MSDEQTVDIALGNDDCWQTLSCEIEERGDHALYLNGEQQSDTDLAILEMEEELTGGSTTSLEIQGENEFEATDYETGHEATASDILSLESPHDLSTSNLDLVLSLPDSEELVAEESILSPFHATVTTNGSAAVETR